MGGMKKLSNNEGFKITEKAASKIKEVLKDKKGLRWLFLEIRKAT